MGVISALTGGRADAGRIPGTIDLGVTELLGLPSLPLPKPSEVAADVVGAGGALIGGLPKLPSITDINMWEILGIPQPEEIVRLRRERMIERLTTVVFHADPARNRRDMALLRTMVAGEAMAVGGMVLWAGSNKEFIVDLTQSVARCVEPYLPTTDEALEAVGGVVGGKIR